MATSTGLSGYVTFQTEDGNATGEQLYIPIMRFCIPWEPCTHNEARSAGSCNEVRQELASIASTTTSKDLDYIPYLVPQSTCLVDIRIVEEGDQH